MEPVGTEAFEALVAEALATIPDGLRAQMENVAIVVDDQSPPGPLYGLYEGVPLTRRTSTSYAGVRRSASRPGHPTNWPRACA